MPVLADAMASLGLSAASSGERMPGPWVAIEITIASSEMKGNEEEREVRERGEREDK